MSGTSLVCPQCGGQNALPSGVLVLHCTFCDAALWVDRSGLISHYRVPRLLDRQQALDALRRWMAGNDTVKDLDRKATVTAVEPVSFPLWMFRSREAGRGEEVRVEPAAPTPIPQLADLQLPAGQLEAYRPEEGAEITAAAVPIDTARGWLGAAAQHLTETALVHLPLWRCRYQHGGREYTALVEGSTGATLAAVFPAKAETPYYLTAIAGAILFLIAGLLITNPFLKAAVYLVIGLPLALVSYWVTRTV